ncbi:MAG: hypothetical protein HAW60_02025 [Bdellovibrionales bacterium]|nr:hypothetical protein [Bdellovibrionales bacterium]
MKLYVHSMSFFLYLLLLSPFLILSVYLFDSFKLDSFFSFFVFDQEFLNSLAFTFKQSFFSTIITIFLGFLGSLGLLGIKKSNLQKKIIIFFLLPNFIPTLFIALSFFSISSWFSVIFYGLPAIVLTHVFINTGLCSILFFSLFKKKISNIANLAFVESCSFISFWYAVIKLLKYELLISILFFFALYFTSFSIPLLLSSGIDRTLEVFIYEKILLQGSWSQAMFLSMVQVFIFTCFGIIFYFFKKKYSLFNNKQTSLDYSNGLFYFSSTLCLLVPFFISSVIVLGFLSIIIKAGLNNLNLISWHLYYYSFIQGFFVGLGVFVLLLLTASLGFKSYFRKFLTFYISPSLVLMGFSYLILSKVYNLEAIKYFLLFLALSILFWPIFYRLKLESLIESLKMQFYLAQTLGASYFFILKKIIFPQVLTYIGFASGISALWGSGDFALSLILLPKDVSLSLAIHSLLSSYRWEQAAAYSFLLLILGLFLFYLFNNFFISFLKKIN